MTHKLQNLYCSITPVSIQMSTGSKDESNFHETFHIACRILCSTGKILSARTTQSYSTTWETLSIEHWSSSKANSAGLSCTHYETSSHYKMLHEKKMLGTRVKHNCLWQNPPITIHYRQIQPRWNFSDTDRRTELGLHALICTLTAMWN